jgi:hypothetical protein
MLSKRTTELLDELSVLLEQKTAIEAKIEALLGVGTVIEPPSRKRLKVRKPKSESPAEPTPQPKDRKRIVPKFTDAEIEKMIRENDEGKTAREIIIEYGFQSLHDWYLFKSKYKKRHKQSTAPDDIPDFDTADDEESEDEPVVQKPVVAALVGPKRYEYQCSCGYSFKSTIPPQLIKCPDCMGKPKVVEELKEEN